MKVNTISGVERSLNDGTSVQTLRGDKKVPGVLYGVDKNIHFSVDAFELRKLVYTSEFNLVDLEVNGATHRCILKDYQLHPVTDALVHVDMLALKENRAVKVEIPIAFVGVSPGVKAGGSVVRKLRKLRVKTTPERLVSNFEVDISELELGDSVRVDEVQIGEGIEVLNPGAIPIASVEVPRALKSAEAAEETEGEETVEAAPGEPVAE